MGRVGVGLSVGGLALALALGGVYLGRRAVAEEVLVGWLHQRGIAADVKVERIEWDGFTGRIIVGNPDDPDVRIDRVEVDYLIGMPWSDEGFGLSPKRVLLSKPLIKAEWTGEKLSFGSLDPLIEEMRTKPQGAKKTGPVIIVDKGQVLLATPYGAIVALADARLNDSRLEWLKASLNPADLTLDEMSAKALVARIEARSSGDALRFSAEASADALSFAQEGSQTTGSDARLTLAGQIPYPREDVSKAKGPVTLKGDLALARLEGETASGRDLSANLDWSGQLTGWIENFVLNGRGSLQVTGQQLAVAGQDMSGLSLQANDAALSLVRSEGGRKAQGLGWQMEGPLALQARSVVSETNRLEQINLSAPRLKANGIGRQMEVSGPLVLTAGTIQTSDLQLSQVRGNLALEAQRGMVTRIKLSGDLAAAGRYDGLGAPVADDVPEMVQLKQAARDFRLTAPSISLSQTNQGFGLVLGAPLEVRSANGAVARLSALQAPLMRSGAGQMSGAGRLHLSGAGMPRLVVDISQWRVVDGGFSANLGGEGQMDFTPVSGIRLKTNGVLDIRNGQTRFTGSDCAEVEASEVRFGENGLQKLSGLLCPAGQPLFSAGNGQWQLAGQLRNTRMQADFLQMDLENGSGQLKVGSGTGGMALQLTQIQAKLEDAPAPVAGEKATRDLRINPLDVTGQVSLSQGIWRGSLDMAREQHRLANVTLGHDNATHAGRLAFRSEVLSFREGGLQPAMISPMLASYLTNVSADQISMSGEVAWRDETLESHGLISIGDGSGAAGSGLSFDAPMGRLTGLRGTLALADLINLKTDTLQTLTAESLDTVLPLKDLKLTVGLGDGKVNIAEAGLNVGDGIVTARDVWVPLDRSQPVSGLLEVRNLQVNDLLQAAKLGDKASLDARVNGEMMFTYLDGTGWSFRSIDLNAHGGHLSINPEVLTGMTAESGEVQAVDGTAQVEVPPNAVQGFAYQALEDLAIDNLTADVHTLPEGRLAINFRILGRHAPPQKKELRISIMDLFNGNLMTRKLPLPSGTPVILNLKTDWNANELATDIYNYMQSRYDRLDSIEPETTDKK